MRSRARWLIPAMYPAGSAISPGPGQRREPEGARHRLD